MIAKIAYCYAFRRNRGRLDEPLASPRIVQLTTALLMVGLVAAVPGAGPAHGAGAPPDFSAIDSYVQQEMDSDNLPGLALAVVIDDRIEHLRGFGTAGPGKGPVKGDTSFVLGSMSKSFTAMAIMQLVDAGEVDLDSPVRRYLPWFKVASAEASERITLRRLLNHTSGIPEDAPRADAPDATLADHVSALSTVELKSPPGEKHEYSSPNYQVLGAVVEEVSGVPFGRYIERNIFQPLQMNHSFVSAARAEEEGLASGHRYLFGRAVAGGVAYEEHRLPTASLISSSEDMAHYLIAQLNRGRYRNSSVVSEQRLARMHERAVPTDADGVFYGMGWRIGEVAGQTAVFHGGILPDYRSKMVLLPGQASGVVVLTNAGSVVDSFTGATSHRIADGVAGLLAGQQPRTARVGLGQAYAILALLVAIWVFEQVRDILRFGRWRRQLEGLVSGSPRARGRMALRSVWDVAVPAGLLVALPRLTRMSWQDLILSMPDLGFTLLALWSTALCLGAVKAVFTVSAYRRRRSGSSDRGQAGPLDEHSKQPSSERLAKRGCWRSRKVQGSDHEKCRAG